MPADVRLAPFTPAHLSAFAAMLDDPDVQRFTRVPAPPPPGFPERWLGDCEEGRRTGTREVFAVLDAQDTGFLGIAVAPRIDAVARTAELGYVIAPDARGRGVATASLRQLTDWAFAELDPMRLELLISVDNGASKAVAARCGYTYEGTLRSMPVKQDVWADTEIWSRLPSDPPRDV
jgi:ribosomal-protein-alanine N-acetyltransferase